jgi:hypothetical protein
VIQKLFKLRTDVSPASCDFLDLVLEVLLFVDAVFDEAAIDYDLEGLGEPEVNFVVLEGSFGLFADLDFHDIKFIGFSREFL